MNYKELYDLLNVFTGDHYDDSAPNFSLSQDLGIYGGDAEDFILRFSDKFKVDISYFKFSDYFENEGDMISKFVIRFFKKNIPKRDLRISDLKNAIQSGRLVWLTDPVKIEQFLI